MQHIELPAIFGVAVLVLTQLRELLRQIALIAEQWRRTKRALRPPLPNEVNERSDKAKAD